MTQGPGSLQFEHDALYRLGLVRQPFADDLIYEDAGLATQMNVAISLLQSGERVLLVRGEAGLGKTTFLRRIQRQQATGLEPVAYQGHPGSTLGEVLGALVTSSGDPAPEGGASVEQAANHVRGSRRAGSRPVLLVDDAHRLPPEVFGPLLQLFAQLAAQEEGFSVVATFDPGQDQPWSGARPKDLPKELFHTTHLYPLTETQTTEYLEHRFTAAGGDAETLRDEDRLLIHRRARGNPQRINEEAFDLLSRRLARREESKPPPVQSGLTDTAARHGRWLRVAMAGGVGAVVAGAGVAWFALTYLSPVEQVQEQEPPAVAAEEEEPEPEVSPDQAKEVLGLESAPDERPFGLRVPEHYTFSTLGDPAEAPEEAPASEEVASEEAASGPDLEAEASDRLAHDWVREEDDTRYTVQLLAASDAVPLQGYADRHGLEEEARLVRTERDGEAWYLLLYGSHADRDAARDALGGLDPELRQQSPWVRSFASVREALDE